MSAEIPVGFSEKPAETPPPAPPRQAGLYVGGFFAFGGHLRRVGISRGGCDGGEDQRPADIADQPPETPADPPLIPGGP